MVGEIIEVTGSTQSVSVVGADTFFGAHLINCLCQNGLMVRGFSQQDLFHFSAELIVESGKKQCFR